MHKTRQQLSLYLPNDSLNKIESVRRVADPIQYRLIPAHITLCREDEIEHVGGIATLAARLANIPLKPLTLSFGSPQVFDGHGLLLSCLAGEDDFHRLREYLLGSNNIRLQKPHITLAHPRNPKSSGNVSGVAAELPEIMLMTFPTVYHIEQYEHEPWQVLNQFALQG